MTKHFDKTDPLTDESGQKVEQLTVRISCIDAAFTKGLVDGFVNRYITNYRICEINSAK